MNESFVSRLEELGYFKGLDAEKAQKLKQDFEQKGWLGIFNDSHRLYFADAEDLAEGGVGDFIREVEPFLAAHGVKLPKIEEDASGTDYVVSVGGVARRIYDAAEMERDMTEEERGLVWGLSMARGFRIVDELLAKAGSAERTYAINGGNDLMALFLTAEMHEVIMQQPGADPADGPYVPTEDYPLFGEPHAD
jgi:hypothetical protein